MGKNTIKLNESQLKNIIAQSVRKVLNEINDWDLKHVNNYIINDFREKLIAYAQQQGATANSTDEQLRNIAQDLYNQKYSEWESSLIKYGLNGLRDKLKPREFKPMTSAEMMHAYTKNRPAGYYRTHI
jgi:predicted component of type VI protein secretion system